YDPCRDELFYAEDGKGAFLNNRPIRVSHINKICKAFLATGFAYAIKGSTDTNIRNFEKFLMCSLAIRRAGSAALDLCYVACGRFDGFWERDLHPWDSAAGTLIVREAEGVVTRFDNSNYTPYDKEILASNGLIHRAMVKVLNRK
ncbi:MAG: inositol monophosphatase, partial [Candidatus Omnitrophica bacterium]|nr:inositol monophosphatase [Candidatus Omnitrophota bacterium]